MPSAFDIASSREAAPPSWADYRRHRFLILAFVAGPVGCGVLHVAATFGVVQLPSIAVHWQTAVYVLLLAPVLEELGFRGGLQEFLDRTAFGKRKLIESVTLGNAMTSLVFAAAHLIASPPWLAAGVFLPSLVFGRLKQLYPSLVAPILVHGWFNLCYLLAAA